MRRRRLGAALLVLLLAGGCAGQRVAARADARATALLARVPRAEIEGPDAHRHPLLLQAFGVFLASAARQSDAELNRRMRALFPDVWSRARPVFDITRIGPTHYLVTIDAPYPHTGGGFYLFDGAAYVSLVPGDWRSSRHAGAGAGERD